MRSTNCKLVTSKEIIPNILINKIDETSIEIKLECGCNVRKIGVQYIESDDQKIFEMIDDKKYEYVIFRGDKYILKKLNPTIHYVLRVGLKLMLIYDN